MAKKEINDGSVGGISPAQQLLLIFNITNNTGIPQVYSTSGKYRNDAGTNTYIRYSTSGQVAPGLPLWILYICAPGCASLKCTY